MKRLTAILVTVLALALLFISPPASAGQNTVTLGWQQPTAPDLAGWKLYKAATTGGPYTLFVDIPYAGSAQAEYESTQQLTAATESTVYFVLKSYDRNGNESGASNETSYRLDFTAPPIPVQLKIVITPVNP